MERQGRADVLRIVLIVLGLIGLGVASYLTYVHYAGIKPACTAGESCEIVQTSVYSKLAGVPVALLGLLTYVAILASLLVRQNEITRLLTLAITLVGFSFSAYLTYREAHSIHHYCEWCLSSAGILTLLFIGSLIRYLRPPQEAGPPAAEASASAAPAGATPATLTPHGE
jgi:uncharacterized membrane protein